MTQYPKIDRSNLAPEKHRDGGYSEGILKDGRPFRVECWWELNVSYLSYYLPTVGIKDHSPEDLKELLISKGLVSFDDEKFLSEGFSGINASSKKINDASDNELWEIVVILQDEDGNYVKPHTELKEYTFSYEVGLGADKYLVALCKKGIYYIPYFINNSDEPIELIVEREKFEYKNIPSKSYVKLEDIYDSWWFDWSNQINLYLKTAGEELYICFYMRKGFPAYTKKTDNIPVLNRSGWICE